MTVLLTGAGGFLGSHVLEKLLLLADDEIVCIDSFRHNGSYAKIIDVAGEHRSRVTVIPHDLTVPFAESEIFDMRGIETIISVASRASVDESIRSPADFIANNVGLMTNVLELARALEVERLIHMSTDEVHGSDFNRGHQPSSPYAASKAAQEDICVAYATTFGLNVRFVVSSNMFGERQSGLAFIPKLVRLISAGRSVDIHTSQGQPGSRFYNYAGDVARYIAQLSQGELNDSMRVWHYLRGQQRVNNLELARLVARTLNAGLTYREVEGTNSRPGYDPSYKSLPTNSNWNAPVDLSSKIVQTVTWLDKHLLWIES